jgi:hypothetical protein
MSNRSHLFHFFNTMTELSPQAQAVLDAYRSSHLSINNLAAALRTLAEKSGRAFLTIDGEPAQGADYISVADVLAIADEFETQ